jgi:hypothetical protein
MQHIEIHDPTNCTIVNMDAAAGRATPTQDAARTCVQCTQPTWRLTPVCIHCGYDRWARYKIAAGTTASVGALALVILHPLT